jgi:hypothetical protein
MQDRPLSLLARRWVLLVAATYLIGLCSLAVALRHNLGFPLDDSWIHQEIARNLVQHHSFGFTPGVTSSGSSSTLWTFVLSLNYLLFPTHSPVFFPLVLNSILIILSGVLLWRMAILDDLPLLYALALALLPALSGNYVWLAFLGMEHVLFVTLSLVAILLWFRACDAPRDTGLRTSLLTGLALGALGMTRPEGLALCVLLFALYRWCGRTLPDVLRAAVVAVLLLIPSFLINLKTSGTLLPLTLRGRRFLYFGSDKLHIGRSLIRSLTLETYHKVIQHNFFHTSSAWAIIAVPLAFFGCFVLLRRFPNRTSVLVLWATLHYASYCFMLPSTGHGGRYQPFVLVLFPALLAIALFDLIALALRLFKSRCSALLQPVQMLALVLVAALTAATLPRWNVALGDSIYDINHCHRQMAYWLNDHYPPGTKIGVFDMGAIAYFSHIDVVDLSGLVDPNYLPYLLSDRVPQYLNQKGASLVILPNDGRIIHFADRLGLLNNPAIRLVPIHTENIDYDTWLSGNLYTQHAYQFETLYRIVRLNPGGAAVPAPTAPLNK